ncbi:MAG: hypothetical protein NUV52_03110 [Candidatus Roizmanbacteria bacterium]|nr:hypothetical protein [Candidatus Roizmanbacteria bacterium]
MVNNGPIIFVPEEKHSGIRVIGFLLLQQRIVEYQIYIAKLLIVQRRNIALQIKTGVFIPS